MIARRLSGRRFGNVRAKAEPARRYSLLCRATGCGADSEGPGPMFNIEYLLVSGVFTVGGLALFTMLVKALAAAMEIRAILYSLPVG